MNIDTRHEARAQAAERPLPATRTAAATDVAPDDLERQVERRQPSTATTERPNDEALAPLFMPEAGRDFRARWDAIQIGFVDDPKAAVRQADELVRQVLDELARTFSAERAASGPDAGDAGQGSTEALRMALRRYRSFLERLLSL